MTRDILYEEGSAETSDVSGQNKGWGTEPRAVNHVTSVSHMPWSRAYPQELLWVVDIVRCPDPAELLEELSNTSYV